MLNFSNFLKLKFWFDLTPPSLAVGFLVFGLVLLVLLIIVGIIFNLLAKKNKANRLFVKTANMISQASFTMGPIGLLLLFFAYEEIRLFGSRFWFLLWAIGLLVWLGFILYQHFKVAPRLKRAEEIRRQREKYLPKKKK